MASRARDNRGEAPWSSRVARFAARLALLSGLLATAACSASAAKRAATSTATSRPSATATATATPKNTLTLDAAANAYIAKMSQDEQLGQLMLVALSGTTYDGNDAAMVEQEHAGGILLYADNMTSPDQTRQMIGNAQAHATLPLLVLTDEEGGWVDRLQQFYGWRPSATQIGEQGSYSYAVTQAQRTGSDMHVLGFNADFAPDVDVQLVDGPDQSTRTFGTTPDAVTRLAGAYLNGLQSEGVIGCLKHFPGLGAATTDAHLDLPTISRTQDQIQAVELAPYRNLIATGQVDLIMATDLLMPAFDPTLPAELSPTIMTDVLRKQMGYNGVVVTDALYMQGVSKKYSLAQAGVQSIIAGDDLLVGAFSGGQVADMIQALKDAVSSGQLTQQRIQDSVRRILELKMRAGLLPLPPNTAPVAPLGTMRAVTSPTALADWPRH
ncbi:MAG TPA: glycoside hydrolase family 3 N-terminal domain-containing protein [Ktedonobacterales bacterium]